MARRGRGVWNGTPCRAFLVTGACIWLSGCAVGPNYERPAVALPIAFGTPSLAPAVGDGPAAADLVRWWRVLRDPQLDQLVERAIACNPDIDIALTRVQQARLQEIVVLGGMLPRVGGGASVATGSGGDLTRGRVPQSIRAGDDNRGFRSISQIGGFDASWELDLFGKVQRSLEAAQNDAQAQLELRNAVVITVVAEVARTYLGMRGLQIRLEIARRNVATAQRTVDLAAEKLQRGAVKELDRTPAKPSDLVPKTDNKSSNDGSKASSKDDDKASKDEKETSQQENKSENKALASELGVALARADLETQQARLPELTAAISAAESRLALLLGAYAADVDEAIRGPARLPPVPERLRPGIPVDLLRRRPDIRAAERKLAAATERIGVATANLFPSVILNANFGGQGTTGRTGPEPVLHGQIWSVGPGAYWPLLDFGRLDALIGIAEMQAHEDLVRYKHTIIAAVEEVDQAIRQYHLDLLRFKTLSAAQDELRRAIGLSLERYRRGDTDLRAVLDVQRHYYVHSEQTAIAAEGAVLRYVAFYKALGGGWELYADLPPVPGVQPAVVAGVRRWQNGWR